LLSASKVIETYLVDVLPGKQRLDQLYARRQSLSGCLDVIFLIIFAIPNIANRERQRLLEICTAIPSEVVVMPNIPGSLNTLVARDDERKKQTRNRQPMPGAVPSATPAGVLILCLARGDSRRRTGSMARQSGAAGSIH
jgi:hypothetical protein